MNIIFATKVDNKTKTSIIRQNLKHSSGQIIKKFINRKKYETM